ncbi:MAG: ParB/RepB/Spo0J family partition protein [Eubacterium sp.]|nr:ParB/RepB/Spo0J family partition protein [Eubacterium sp.]
MEIVSQNQIPKEEREMIIEIAIERLRDFKRHPFKVKDDWQMRELKDSIAKYGVLIPIIVRPDPDGVYEIISGHRRKYAAKEVGYEKVPVIIRVMSDDEAVLAMIDSNLQRDQLSYSEKAFAYKMKYEALKKVSRKRKNVGGQVGHYLKGKKTIEILGEEGGDSAKQVQRYLKIADLIPELLERLDEGGISFNPAYEISFLSELEQKSLIDAMEYTQASPSLSQAQRMKRLSKEKALTLKEMKKILAEIKKGEISRVTFKNEQLHQYFPKNYTAEMMKKEILDILQIWMNHYWTRKGGNENV